MKLIFIIPFLVQPTVELLSQYSSEYLKEITTSLPESIYTESGIEKEKIEACWNRYHNNKLERLYTGFLNNIYRDYNYRFEELNDDSSCCVYHENYCIDVQNGLFKISNTTTQIQIKISMSGKDTIIGVSANIFDVFTPPIQKVLLFYNFKNGRMIENRSVLNSYDFAKDNFSKSTIDFLNKREILNAEKGQSAVIATFTPGDTTYLFMDLYDLSLSERPNGVFLDQLHFDGEMFWRAYRLKKGQFRPLGKVKKKD